MTRISIPSAIDFTDKSTKQHKNKHLTYGKLKILHTGMTVDGRSFSFESLEGLIENLPHTPITGNYIPDKEDFGGHDAKKQVYGFIPEVGEYGLEEIDGEEWVTAEVGLFTGVSGGVGEIAAEIIGKSHSMELDPEGIELEFKKVDGKTQMTIKKATIKELCVLGDSHTPAFAGSKFFTEMSEEEQLTELIRQYSSLESVQQNNFAVNSELNGGAEMEKYLEFMKKTYGEKISEIYEILKKKVNYDLYILQIGDDSVVIRDFDDFKTYRYEYTVDENSEYIFGEPVEVFERYLTNEEINGLFTENVESDFEVTDNENELDEEQNLDPVSENDETADDELDFAAAEVETPEAEDVVEIETEEQIIERTFGMSVSSIKEALSAHEANKVEIQRLQAIEKEGILAGFYDILDESELSSIRENFSNLSNEQIKKEASYIGFSKIKNRKEFSTLRFSGIQEDQPVLDTTKSLIDKYK